MQKFSKYFLLRLNYVSELKNKKNKSLIDLQNMRM